MTLAELRELYAKLTGEARQLNNEGKIDEASSKLEERKKIQKQIDIAEELEEEEKRSLKSQHKTHEVSEMRSAVLYALGKTNKLSEEERAVIKTSDNAALIPEPILKEIEIKKGYKSLKSLCNIRPVTASKGTIPVIDLDQNELLDVTEGDDLVDGTLVSTEVSYNCANAGLIQQLTTDLVDDSVVEIEGIAKNNFVTIAAVKENKKILSVVDANATKIDGATTYKDVELELAKALPSNKAGLIVLVNPKAYATLKTARDKNDRSLNLITNINGQEYVFDTCPIHAFDNGLVASTDTKELYYILDMKEAVQFIDRKGITILRDTNIKKMGAPIIAVGEKFDVVKGSKRSIKKIEIGV